MGQLLLSTITGLISGVVSSLLFFWVMSMMRPKLELSCEICKDRDDTGIFYGFKILNKSIHNVLDLRIELILKTPFNSNGGPNHTNEWLNLRKDHIMLFPRYSKKDKDGSYALVITTRDDLETKWNNASQLLEIRVHGKHSFSGINKSFEQKYYTKKNCIKDGMFNFGRTLVIS